jgi:ComF family protein
MERGFDHTWLLANALAHQALPQTPVRALLRQQQHRKRQHRLGATARRRNVKDLFSASENVKDARLLLVDDVMTTGATLSEASQCLLGAGAQRVDVWVLARAEASAVGV